MLEHVHDNREISTAGSRNEGPSIVTPRQTSRVKRAVFAIGHVAAKIGLSERRKVTRFSARELNVNLASDAEEQLVKVRDISPTGAYLVTDRRWLIGTTLLLNLQSRTWRHRESAPRVRLQVKVVRLDRDGVGVSFLDEYADEARWRSFVSRATSLTTEDGAVRVFRMANALAFLLRISPSAENAVVRLLCEKLSEERVEGTLDVVLRAEEQLSSADSPLKSTVLPRLLLRILVDASKSNEESMQRCWAGLLAKSSLKESSDDESLSFAGLLSKLEAVHVRILAAAGQRAIQAGFQTGTIASQELLCTMEEMKRITRTRNAALIECAVNRLYEFGLLELTVKNFGCASLDHANLAPTSLGLALYQACFEQPKLSEVVDTQSIKVAS